jgi:hypothetical protein
VEIKIKWIKRKQMTHENTYRDDIDISPRIFSLMYCCFVSVIIVICVCPPGGPDLVNKLISISISVHNLNITNKN